MERHRESPVSLRDTFPLQRQDLVLLAVAYGLLTLVWSVLGWVVVEGADNSALVRADERVANWFVERRTPRLDDVSLVGSYLSETIVKIVVTAVIVVLLLRIVRRWIDALIVAVPLILEAMAFITVTWIVGRPRPDVVRLDSSPVGSSFPSGHVAAAACYAAVAIVVFWHTRNRWLRALTVAVVAVTPIVVALARMYRGMHYLTDVVAGAFLGAAAVLVATWILLRAEARRLAREAEVRRAAHDQPDLDPAVVGAASVGTASAIGST